MRRRAIFRILGILGLAGASLYLLPSLPLTSRAETGHLMKIHSNFSKDCSLAALRSSVLMSSEPYLNAHLQKCKSTLDDLRRLGTTGAALDQRITVQYGFLDHYVRMALGGRAKPRCKAPTAGCWFSMAPGFEIFDIHLKPGVSDDGRLWVRKVIGDAT